MAFVNSNAIFFTTFANLNFFKKGKPKLLNNNAKQGSR